MKQLTLEDLIEAKAVLDEAAEKAPPGIARTLKARNYASFNKVCDFKVMELPRTEFTFIGIPVLLSNDVPPNEIHAYDREGNLVGVIKNLRSK